MAVRVLLVDDVEDLRVLFRTVLDADERFEVVGEAGDGIEAIEKARELKPDVIMLDIAMPRLDGLQAIPRLHEAAPGTRILVLSGFESTRLARTAIEACATGFLEKGAQVDVITQTLHEVHLSPAKFPRACPATT